MRKRELEIVPEQVYDPGSPTLDPPLPPPLIVHLIAL